MLAVLTGLSPVVTLIGLGAVGAWRGWFTRPGQVAMQQVAFYFASPALLFTVMARGDMAMLRSPVVVVFTVTALVTAALFLFFARPLLGLRGADTVVAAASASYVNSNNMGLPISLYIIGNLDAIPAVIMVQVIVFAPVVIGALQAAKGGHRPLSLIWRTLTTPLIIGTVAGVIVSLTGVRVPDIIWVPLEVLGGAAIPLMLLAFGASLHSPDTLRKPEQAGAVLVASTMKVAVMPLIAYVLARFAFGLSDTEVFAVTVISALPTAQNIFNFAVNFQTGERLVRDTIVVTSFTSLPVIAVIALMLKP